MPRTPPHSESDYSSRQRAADAAYCRRHLNRLIESYDEKVCELQRQIQASTDPAAGQGTVAPGPARSVMDIAAELERVTNGTHRAINLSRRLNDAEQVGDHEARDRIMERDRFIRALASALRRQIGGTQPQQGGTTTTLPRASERSPRPPASSGPLPGPTEQGATILPFPTRPRGK